MRSHYSTALIVGFSLTFLIATSGKTTVDGILGMPSGQVVAEYSLVPVNEDNCGVDGEFYWDCEMMDRNGNIISLYNDTVTRIKVTNINSSSNISGISLIDGSDLNSIVQYINTNSLEDFIDATIILNHEETHFVFNSNQLASPHCGMMDYCIYSFTYNNSTLNIYYEVSVGNY